eukprot:382190-Amphidinium_carterae.1
MDNCTSSIDVVNISDIQDDYTAEDYLMLNNNFPAVPTENTDEYEEYNEMIMNIRMKKDDIANFSQTLNYVFVHSTKPGEAHSIAVGTQQFTRQYYKWLEDINRYELENGQGSITNHVKIATITNHRKGPIAHLTLRVNNTTTFTEVHHWISNFFHSTHTGTEDDNAAIGAVTVETEKYNELMMVAFNNGTKALDEDNGTKERAQEKTKVAKRETTTTTTRWKRQRKTTNGKQSYPPEQQYGDGKSIGKQYNNYNKGGKKRRQSQQVFNILDSYNYNYYNDYSD